MKKLVYCLSLLLFALPSIAQLKVSKLFSDNAVLQRDIETPVWGTAKANEAVSIQFDQVTNTIQADENGQWSSSIPARKAGGPYVLTISTDKEKIEFKNILIGDVWICSGQSNMEWIVANSDHAKEEIVNAGDDQIRHFKIPNSYSFLPQDTLVGGQWEVCSPATAGSFTAVGYFFAKAIRKHQKVPIGLLNTSWGGSRIEPWMRAETVGYTNADESAQKLSAYMDSIKSENISRLEKLIGKLPEKDFGMKGDFPIWASSDYNHNNWQKMSLPGVWESKGYPGLDGAVWFRKEIYLTADEAKSELSLHLGAIDDADISFWNGQEIGKTDSYSAERNYRVAAEKLRAGVNVLTVRVYDSGWSGGFTGKCEALYYQSTKARKSLCGDWHFKVGLVELKNVVRPIDHPTLLYHQMIHPIIDFPIKGVLWYQGESNARFEDAKKYHQQFSTMIQDWRKLWNCGDFPFLWVQLANWQQAEDQPTDTGWARLREAQSKSLETANTAQAVIIDIGDADDIHPRNKQDVGLRLSLGARKIAYGEDLVYSGPVYKSMHIEQNKVRLDFELFNSALVNKDGMALQSFAIAGADKKFYWADAVIEGNQIVVSSKEVPHPVAVRYAWADNPDKANLYNTEGIPASPFRTDDW